MEFFLLLVFFPPAPGGVEHRLLLERENDNALPCFRAYVVMKGDDTDIKGIHYDVFQLTPPLFY